MSPTSCSRSSTATPISLMALPSHSRPATRSSRSPEASRLRSLFARRSTARSCRTSQASTHTRRWARMHPCLPRDRPPTRMRPREAAPTGWPCAGPRSSPHRPSMRSTCSTPRARGRSSARPRRSSRCPLRTCSTPTPRGISATRHPAESRFARATTESGRCRAGIRRTSGRAPWHSSRCRPSSIRPRAGSSLRTRPSSDPHIPSSSPTTGPTARDRSGSSTSSRRARRVALE